MMQRAKNVLERHKKYLPVLFFMGGFIWDSLTLGRVDSLYSNFVLCTYLTSLTVCLYLFNLADDGAWKDTFLEACEEYLPLAIQFFLGGLCSAYVIFYSRSVSLTKTMAFFVILVILLFANELLKHRISNKYLQFGAYFFVNFTFFTFFLPILLNSMNTFVFLVSGAVSVGTTLFLILYLYVRSPSTRKEIGGLKITGLIVGLYLLINFFYFFNLIPPVPLALENGIVAQHVQKDDNRFTVTYSPSEKYTFWCPHSPNIAWQQGDSVFVYTSIFAPADLQKSVFHLWNWYSPHTQRWEVTDKIGYEITGGRTGGYRGYTYKEKLMPGNWKVDVVTQEGLVLGSINFQVSVDSTLRSNNLIKETF
ncbi:DUF2914 domain-containing protein [Aliifodinibius sp. S!AR15-10]|uniref:DUF2914 domain-containing protein n=1 Tax=Aliifodinibius sp. S!AR15-10 TaxID=2950437 RepID=UPI002861AED1|nr:DUF2914 domain-containing protein [Aliifodinibius sp. S!AR15-10]MDR8391826.1 DUF2914 domain-containing protein [Aliifodinibius sp. S!AR15-10]